MQEKKSNKLTRREAMTRLGVVATAGYIVPGFAAFSAAHASSEASSSSEASEASESSEVSETSVASTPSGVSKPSLPSLPSDAGITEKQKDAYKECGEGGGSEADCRSEAGISG